MVATNKRYELKVLMTTDTVGGVWTYCIELMQRMARRNVQFLLVTAGAPLSTSQREEVISMSNVLLHETTLALEWMEDPWVQVDEYGQLLLRLEQEYQPHIIHLNFFTAGTLPFQAPVLMVAHSDVCTWWDAVKGGSVPDHWSYYSKRVRDGISGCNLLVAPSKSYLNSLKRMYQIEPRCRVIYNSRRGQLFEAGEKTNSVIGIGRVWDEAKNLLLLAHAAKSIDAHVTIAGENKFEGSGVMIENDGIELTGKLSTTDIALKLSKTAIYALPARYEPFGLSVLEAALSGCALVLGDIDTLREIWQDAALYVPTDRPDELAESINELIHDEERRMELALRAKSRAAYFDTDRMGIEYMDCYESLKHHAILNLKPETV